MDIKQISPQQAKELLDSGDNYIYVDVRSEAEFEQGHPSNSVNIPIQQLNPSLQMLEPNEEFIDVVEANFAKDAKLILGCASGPRSTRACEMLAECGYEDFVNVDGGFSGARDMYGNIAKQGWVQLGFPVEQGDGGDRSYNSLRKKYES